MKKDIKKMLARDLRNEARKMPEGHEKRFEALLDQEWLQRKGRTMPYVMKIAATLLAMVALGVLLKVVIQTETLSDRGVVDATAPSPEALSPTLQSSGDGAERKAENEIRTEGRLTLGDLSPQYKELETYYRSHIRLALSELVTSDADRELFNSYMEQMAVLSEEYDTLTKELNKVGPDSQIIQALIQNLQWQLQLLQQLQDQPETLNEENDDIQNPYQA